MDEHIGYAGIGAEVDLVSVGASQKSIDLISQKSSALRQLFGYQIYLRLVATNKAARFLS